MKFFDNQFFDMDEPPDFFKNFFSEMSYVVYLR